MRSCCCFNPVLLEVVGPERDGLCASSYSKEGWPASMYGVSKLCEATYSRVLAEQLKPRGVAVYACCPGWGTFFLRYNIGSNGQ